MPTKRNHMPVLILKNIASEGPGTIAEHLDAHGLRYKVLEAEQVTASTSLDGYDTLVVLGGPMGVYELDRHPHMREGIRLMQEASAKGLKVLGVCLGAQMLAHALGARVYKGHGEEAGWLSVTSTGEGRSDSAFGALTEGYESPEFHGAPVARRHVRPAARRGETRVVGGVPKPGVRARGRLLCAPVSYRGDARDRRAVV